MTCLELSLENREEIHQAWQGDKWIVSCLCAAWCDVCHQFRPSFESLADKHPDLSFVWIDIEDQADVVGDFDVENFPTLLIQRSDTVVFYGTVLPDARQIGRLLDAQLERSLEDLRREATSTEERRTWQEEYDLRKKLDGQRG